MILLFPVLLAQGQDLHFSQFTATPTYINPSLTGKFNGDTRVTLNSRTQWKSVTVPYRTFAGAVDFSRLGTARHLGTGLSVYYDRAGDSRLTTLKADLAAAYKFVISYDRRHLISLGLQGGLKNITIDYSALEFDNQYNGTAYDPAAPNGEQFSIQQVLGASFSSGLVYLYTGKKEVILFGAGVYNLVRSDQSFFETGESPLDTRVNLHASGEISIKEQYVLIPSVFYGQQGILKEMIIGTQLKQILVDEVRVYRAFSLGGYYRNRDAGFITGNLEINDYNFGLSYDFNLSGLKKASGYRGAFEVSLIYIYSKVKAGSRRFKTCPVFI